MRTERFLSIPSPDFESPPLAAILIANQLRSNSFDRYSPYLDGAWSVLWNERDVSSRRLQYSSKDQDQFIIGMSLGSSLKHLGWTKKEASEADARLIWLQQGFSGELLYQNTPIILLSSLLHHKQNYEILYRILQQKKPSMTEENIQAIRYELQSLYLLETRSYDHMTSSDDVVPYLWKHRVPKEVLLPFTSALEDKIRSIATYGGINADVLHAAADRLTETHGLRKAEVCAEHDELLGIHMPESWYFNPGNMTTALFYNWVQIRDYVTNQTENRFFRDHFGITGLVECYSIIELQEFAEKSGYIAFSTPYDLEHTGNFISSEIEYLYDVENSSPFLQFVGEILNYCAGLHSGMTRETYLTSLLSYPIDERRNIILRDMKHFWVNLLIPRGIQHGDQEIILVNTQHIPQRGLDVTRRPNAVFIGGNIDPLHNPDYEEMVIENNFRIATAQYPESTNLVVPLYRDRYGNTFHPHLLYSRQSGVSTDTILLSLLTLRETGQSEAYVSLRSRYETLVHESECNK